VVFEKGSVGKRSVLIAFCSQCGGMNGFLLCRECGGKKWGAVLCHFVQLENHSAYFLFA